MKIGIVAVILALVPRAYAAAPATEPSDSVFAILEEEEKVTTGSRVENKVSEASSFVWVIDHDAIMHSAAQTLSDLLRQIPGIVVTEFTDGDGQIPAAHGTTLGAANQMLLVVDGRSTFRDAFGTSDIRGNAINLSDIDRIEVVLGPSTTLYGAAAYDGVIQVFTRPLPASGMEVRANLEGGGGFAAYGLPQLSSTPQPLATLSASYAQRIDDWAFRLSLRGEYEGAAPVLPTPTVSDPQTDPQALEHGVATADIAYTGHRWDIRGQFFGDLSPQGTSDLGQRINGSSSQFGFSLNAKRADLFAKGDEFLANALVDRIDVSSFLRFSTSPLIQFPLNPSTVAGEVLLQYSPPRFYKNRLLVGVQAHWFDLDWALVRPEGRFQHFYGLFATDEYRPIDNLILSAGLRVEGHESAAYSGLGQITLAPRGSIVFLPKPGQTIRAEISQSYLNPAPIYNFVQLNYEGLQLLIPNEKVQPEGQWMASLGYRGYIVRGVEPFVQGFFGRKTNNFESVALNPAQPLSLSYINGISFDYIGATAGLDASPIPELKLFANYTYYSSLFVKGLAQDTPHHFGGAGARWQHGALNIALAVFFESTWTEENLLTHVPQTLAGRIIINPRVGYEITRQWEIYAAGMNLGDFRFGGVDRDVVDPTAERIGPKGWLGVKWQWDR